MNSLISSIDLVGSGAYIVVKGDTLDIIAKKFNTTKNAIKKDNFLEGEVYQGQLLYVKKYDIIHQVSVEETLKDIAEKYGVLPEDILKQNQLEFIYPYARLIILKDENY